MKKITLILGLFAFTFVGCKTSSTASSTGDTEVKPTDTSPKKATDLKSLTYPTE